jgi:hypothetical protein
MKESPYIKLINYGACFKRETSGHVDCLLGCTHPPLLLVLCRIILYPFQKKPIIGYCELIKKETLVDSIYVDYPGPTALDELRSELNALESYNKIIGTAFKKK